MTAALTARSPRGAVVLPAPRGGLVRGGLLRGELPRIGAALLLVALLVAAWFVLGPAAAAHAAPSGPSAPSSPDAGNLTVKITGPNTAPSTSVLVLIGITLLSVAPALLLMMTSFTKIFVVLAMARNALGLTTVPPNQVIAGLSMFLSLFIMWPVVTKINTAAVQPFTKGKIDFNEALSRASVPLQHFMVQHTRESDIALMTRAAGLANPSSPSKVPLVTLIPSFMLSELRAAFIIGLVIFVPFLVIDIVVSSGLMAMGMMMLPPVMISLPFKILLFVLVDGWSLIITSLVQSYSSG